MVNSFFNHIVRFVKQSDAGALGSSGYPKVYSNTTTKFGFGQGNPARVPWISFTAFNQSVQEGIYPVYLYYKEQRLLILAYGLSATRPPRTKWILKQDNTQTVGEFFHSNRLGIPPKYKESYVFKQYNLSQLQDNYGLTESSVINDLNELIGHYNEVFSSNIRPASTDDPISERPVVGERPLRPPVIEKPAFEISSFLTSARSVNFMITEHLATRYIASLLTKPFVILTGLSGSGKTKLAQLFAEWICASSDQYRLVAVGADWTNREPLLGYPNALDESKYVSPDNRVLELIIHAKHDLDKPFFLILDEMNMSHVERYFSDFLSAMESGKEIFLHSGRTNINDIPAALNLPPNLFIVGTVNVDETTYMFSPKVLDRANVIEFKVSTQEMRSYLDSNTSLILTGFHGQGESMAKAFLDLKSIHSIDNSFVRDTLLLFFSELQNIGAEFGYRSASEIIKLCSMMTSLAPDMPTNQIIDYAILQKMLPKVHGSRRKLEPVLRKLTMLCVSESYHSEIDNLISGKIDMGQVMNHMAYPESLNKILRMFRSMTDNGFTSFAEA